MSISSQPNVTLGISPIVHSDVALFSKYQSFARAFNNTVANKNVSFFEHITSTRREMNESISIDSLNRN